MTQYALEWPLRLRVRERENHRPPRSPLAELAVWRDAAAISLESGGVALRGGKHPQ